MADDTISTADLAALFGLAPTNVRDLARRGIIKRLGRGAFDRDDATRSYIAHLRGVASGRGGDEQVADLSKERALLAREQRRSYQIKNEASEKALIPASEVRSAWDAAMAAIRARLLAIPTRVTQRLPHLTRHDTQMIDRAIRDALTQAADDVDGDYASDHGAEVEAPAEGAAVAVGGE